LLCATFICFTVGLKPYDDYAPFTTLEDAANVTAPLAWTMFKQCDAAWGSEKLGTCADTICQAGCAMSSVAMILATKGWKGNPGTLNTWLKANGGYVSGCDIVWSTVNKLGLITYQGSETAAYSTICTGVQAGHGVIINVRNNAHWVLVTGCNGGNVFTVNDPGFTQGTYTYAEASHESVYH